MGKHETASRKRARGLLGRAGYKSGGHVDPDAAQDRKEIAAGIHAHERKDHPGTPLTKLKAGGRISGAAARQRLDRARRGKYANGGAVSQAGGLKQADRAERAPLARGGRTKGRKGGNHVHIQIIPGGGAGAGGPDPAVVAQAAHRQGLMQGAALAAHGAGAGPRPPMMPPGGMPPGGMAGGPMPPPGAGPGGPPPGGPMPPMRRGGRTPYKRGGRTKAALTEAFHEIKANPPKILAKTKAKSGPARAESQRVAIGLSKARAAGARIPKAGGGATNGPPDSAMNEMRDTMAKNAALDASDRATAAENAEKDRRGTTGTRRMDSGGLRYLGAEQRRGGRVKKATGGGLSLTRAMESGSGGGKGRLTKRDFYAGKTKR